MRKKHSVSKKKTSENDILLEFQKPGTIVSIFHSFGHNRLAMNCDDRITIYENQVQV